MMQAGSFLEASVRDPRTDSFTCVVVARQPVQLSIVGSLPMAHALNKTINDGALIRVRLGSSADRARVSRDAKGGLVLTLHRSIGLECRDAYQGSFTYRILKFDSRSAVAKEVKPLEFCLSAAIDQNSATSASLIQEDADGSRVAFALKQIREWGGQGRYVYFVRGGIHCKIGISSDPIRRLGSLQTANSSALELIATVPGSPVLERKLHEIFAAERIQGEWFAITPTLARLLETVSASNNAAAA